MFALEISVNGKQGEILLNPGNYKLPKPYSWHNEYEYFGYMIAQDIEDAERVFAEAVNESGVNKSDEHEFESVDTNDRLMIAAEFHNAGGEDDDEINMEGVENMEGDFHNMCQ